MMNSKCPSELGNQTEFIVEFNHLRHKRLSCKAVYPEASCLFSIMCEGGGAFPHCSFVESHTAQVVIWIHFLDLILKMILEIIIYTFIGFVCLVTLGLIDYC